MFTTTSIVVKKGDNVTIHFYNVEDQSTDRHSFSIDDKPYTMNVILDGGKGDDKIYGGDGNDRIRDGNNNPPDPGGEADYGNKVYGGSGNDNINVGTDYLRADFYYVY